MKRFIYFGICMLWAVAGFAQQTIPVAIAVQTGSTMVLHVYAKGVQIYLCTQDPKDTSRYVWAFQEPQADLFSNAGYTKKIGKHDLSAAKSPTWELTDGSIISGLKLRQAPSADSLAIPQLLLSAVAGTGKGRLSQVRFIQRLNTKAGNASSKADRSQKGTRLEVPYTAEYYFYK